MNNYTIELHGWTLDAKAKSITKKQIEIINRMKVENEIEELSEIKFDIEDTIGLDDWNILNISKPFWYLDNTLILVKDDKNNEVNRFELSEIIHHNNYEPNVVGKLFILIPGVEFDNILFSVDELKGGICDFIIKSDKTPIVTDFSVLDGAIEGPDSEWEFIDSIYFKGSKLEINSFLDSDCKSSEVFIYSN
tara:strand:+ start:2598 stop:3173 length:576 start_codon:yes stop_codon:yes gene_type:complete